ncbi:MAG: nucleotide exchange factor GrpE [Ruminococcaceae bacterium]|nr:nucleotide exchange factor GrpE [Oscillospiraceae bacterium]
MDAENKVVQPEQEAPAETPKEEKKTKKPSKTAVLEQKLAEKEAELAAVSDQYQRMLAEYANYKRRTEQEKMQIGAFTKAELLTELLVSVDNMEKAIAAPAGDEYKTGVDMVLRQFMDTLYKLGLEPVGVEGEPFDPNVHNAVMREDADDVEKEIVSAVFQKGYKLGDRVLRPAMVKVKN